MKLINGVWLPDNEEHLIKFLADQKTLFHGKGTYQKFKLDEAVKYVKKFDFAIDVGGHCGLWSMTLEKLFKRVVAFEPIEKHRECFVKNSIAELIPFALGDKDGFVNFETGKNSTGDTRVKEYSDSGVEIKRLDDFGFDDVDFIKIDCEGYEYFVLRGGEGLIKKCRPCIIVEQKPGRGSHFGLRDKQAIEYLRDLGAILRAEISGDFIMSWD